MSEGGDRMDAVVTALAAIAGAPWIVNRDFYGTWRSSEPEDLKNGVLSVVSSGMGAFAKKPYQGAGDEGPHPFLVVGRKLLADSATGTQVEDAELEILDLVRGLVMSTTLPEEICRMQITGGEQSNQTDAPHCWVVVQCEIELSI